MKKLTVFIVLLVITLCTTNANAAELPGNSPGLKGNSNTFLGNYEIKELPQVVLKGESLRAFELTYEKAQKPVLIYLEERSNCKDYVVRSKNLEVAYRCKKSSFGVQFVPVKHQKYKPEINVLFLAQDEFQKQQKISDGQLPLETALDLIASYYPHLLKRSDLLN